MRSFRLKFKRDSNHRIDNLTNQPLAATVHLMASVLNNTYANSLPKSATVEKIWKVILLIKNEFLIRT